MKCDIIIPIWNQLEFTKTCIERLIENTIYPYKLILIDNGSDFETRNYIESLKQNRPIGINLIRNEENLGFVKAINQGLKASNAPYVCILNNDTEPGYGWLSELIEFAKRHPDVGLLNPLCNGHIQRNMTLNEYAKLISSNKNKYMEMNQCQGFCMLIKREVIDKIGYLDERFGIGGFDDTDYSMRAHRAGYGAVCVYSSYVYHKEHKSFDKMGERKNLQAEAEKEYFKKWPKHRRLAVIYSMSRNTNDHNITNLLNSSLFLARKWCWVNLLIFGGKSAKERIYNLEKKINFPLHQNIKFNYLNNKIKIFEIVIRILERSFGSKKRKKYDLVICNEKPLYPILKRICDIQKCAVKIMDFNIYNEDELKNAITPFKIISKEDIYPVRLQEKFNGVQCDIILPVCDQYDFTKKCIESIIENTDTPYRLIVINNGKNPNTRRLLEDLSDRQDVEVAVVNNEHNIGWVKALNKGIELSKAPYICFQNDDTVVTRGWLRKMINILNLKEEFGLINPTWEGRPKDVSIDRYNDMLEKKQKERYIETDWCRGFSVVLKRAVVDRIGKIDERYGLAYFDDVDYSVTAIEAGFIALRALDTYVYHHRNVTFFEILKGPGWNELHEKNKLIYYKKWGKPLKISIILDSEKIKDKDGLKDIASTSFYLARKQHRLYIWGADKASRSLFSHTNIITRNYPLYLSNPLMLLDLYLNIRKKKDKRYDAVFVYDKNLCKRLKKADFKDLDIFYNNKPDFNDFVKKTIDDMKEKTKETVNV